MQWEYIKVLHSNRGLTKRRNVGIECHKRHKVKATPIGKKKETLEKEITDCPLLNPTSNKNDGWREILSKIEMQQSFAKVKENW